MHVECEGAETERRRKEGKKEGSERCEKEEEQRKWRAQENARRAAPPSGLDGRCNERARASASHLVDRLNKSIRACQCTLIELPK